MDKNILVIDKPSGMTSHDVVVLVRKKLKIQKVGHCGTLDPMATGVLVILLDKATKLSSVLSADEKEYLCTMRLGATTDTHDADGNIVDTIDSSNIEENKIREIILSFGGRQGQIPPMVSAKRYKGKRLYDLARQGISIEREPVQIDIKDIEITAFNRPDVELRVCCSKGTYIRTLCHDIGQRLGCGAHMVALRRLRSGDFHIDDAVELASL